MDEKILERVDALADKLGTTAQYLWTVLVADVRAKGAFMACCGVALLVFAAWCVRRCARLPKDAWDGDSARPVPYILGVVFGVALGSAAFSIGATDFLAPHLAALNVIMGKE